MKDQNGQEEQMRQEAQPAEMAAKGGKRKKSKNPDDRVGFFRLVRWQSSAVSVALNTLLLGYITYYCTDVLQLSAALVGTLLLVSKVVDAVTDLVAGVIIDRTETRWGKGRPYEIFMLFLWLATWALYSTPAAFSTAAKCVWIFCMYSFVNAICKTFLNGNNCVYLVRAFKTRTQQVKVTAYGSFFTMAAGFAFNILFPQMLVRMGTSHDAWSVMALKMAIPLTLLGLLRILTIPEQYNQEADVKASGEKLNLGDVKQLFQSNRYLLAITVIALLYNIVTSMGVGTYFFKYIVGNVGLMSVTSAFTVLGLPVAFLLPRWAGKYGMAKTSMIGFIVAGLTGLGIFIGGGKIFAVVILCMLISTLAVVPYNMMGAVFIMEMADYNEYRGIPRMEGTMGALKGLAEKVGSALGGFILGVMLSVSGYDGALEAQPQSAITMILLLSSIFPLLMYLLMAFLFHKGYAPLDAMKPEITAALEEKKAAHASEQAV